MSKCIGKAVKNKKAFLVDTRQTEADKKLKLLGIYEED